LALSSKLLKVAIVVTDIKIKKLSGEEPTPSIVGKDRSILLESLDKAYEAFENEEAARKVYFDLYKEQKKIFEEKSELATSIEQRISEFNYKIYGKLIALLGLNAAWPIIDLLQKKNVATEDIERNLPENKKKEAVFWIKLHKDCTPQNVEKLETEYRTIDEHEKKISRLVMLADVEPISRSSVSISAKKPSVVESTQVSISAKKPSVVESTQPVVKKSGLLNRVKRNWKSILFWGLLGAGVAALVVTGIGLFGAGVAAAFAVIGGGSVVAGVLITLGIGALFVSPILYGTKQLICSTDSDTDSSPGISYSVSSPSIIPPELSSEKNSCSPPLSPVSRRGSPLSECSTFSCSKSQLTPQDDTTKNDHTVSLSRSFSN